MVLNFLLALLPIIWLFIAFLVLKLPGHIGCLISPQSIAVAIAAIGLSGADGKIMSQTVKYCILFGLIVCVLSYLSAVLI